MFVKLGLNSRLKNDENVHQALPFRSDSFWKHREFSPGYSGIAWSSFYSKQVVLLDRRACRHDRAICGYILRRKRAWIHVTWLHYYDIILYYTSHVTLSDNALWSPRLLNSVSKCIKELQTHSKGWEYYVQLCTMQYALFVAHPWCCG